MNITKGEVRTAAESLLDLVGRANLSRAVALDACKNGCVILRVSADTRSIVAVRGW